METVARRGNAPQIVSPKSGVVYSVRAGDDASRSLALRAEAEADVTTLYWFADKTFLGESRATEAFHWQPKSGSYTIVVLDDQGRSNSRAVVICEASGFPSPR
jgi:penicillin-binding protein 1C